MDLFFDDPNTDIDSDERANTMRMHLLGFLGGFLPPLNMLLPYIVHKTMRQKTDFSSKHLSSGLNFQFLFCLFVLLGVGLYFVLHIFYVLLYMLFLLLFQSIISYKLYTAAKNGVFAKRPFNLGLF